MMKRIKIEQIKLHFLVITATLIILTLYLASTIQF
jgi:hypothetical protein